MAEAPKADQWTVLKFPAVRETLDDSEDTRQLGEALWPARHSLESLEKKRAASPYDWHSIYQQRPVAPGSIEWGDEFFPSSIWFDDFPEVLKLRVMSLDPSKGKDAKSGDYSAFILAGLCGDGKLWVEADLDRRPINRGTVGGGIIEDGVNLFRRFGPAAFVIEINQFQSMLCGEFMRAAKKAGLPPLPLWGITNTDPKVVRIRTLGPYLARGDVRFRNTRGTRMLVQQLKAFPSGEHDDGPDSLEMAIRMLWHLLGHKTGKAPELVRA